MNRPRRDVILHEFLSPEVSRAVYSIIPEDVRSPVWTKAALCCFAKTMQPLLDVSDSAMKSLCGRLSADDELRLRYFEEYSNLGFEALLAKEWVKMVCLLVSRLGTKNWSGRASKEKVAVTTVSQVAAILTTRDEIEETNELVEAGQEKALPPLPGQDMQARLCVAAVLLAYGTHEEHANYQEMLTTFQQNADTHEGAVYGLITRCGPSDFVKAGMSCMLMEEDKGSLWDERLIESAGQLESRSKMMVIDSTPESHRDIFRVVYQMGGISKAAEVLRGMVDSGKTKRSVVGSVQPSGGGNRGNTTAGTGAGYSGCHECKSLEHKKYQCPAWKAKRAARRREGRENRENSAGSSTRQPRAAAAIPARQPTAQPNFPPYQNVGTVGGVWRFVADPNPGETGQGVTASSVGTAGASQAPACGAFTPLPAPTAVGGVTQSRTVVSNMAPGNDFGQLLPMPGQANSATGTVANGAWNSAAGSVVGNVRSESGGF